MKKTLCYIEQIEIDNYVSLLQNEQTFKTLYLLKKEQKKLDDATKSDILNAQSMIKNKINDWWESITTKYHIPYYVDREMHIDPIHKSIYIEE